jgi:hypothetical protein
LSKLKFYGITGKAKALFTSHLKNRYQRVILGNTDLNHNTFPGWGKIEHDIPQGSILGPFPFLPYINDLPKAINNESKTILFASDTNIIATNPNSIDFKSDIYTVFGYINILLWF